MKKTISFLLLIVLLVSFSACSIGEKKATSNQVAVEETIKNNSDKNEYPSPKDVTWEKSDNSLGARYIFTLQDFCKRMQKIVDELGAPVVTFKEDDWEILSKDLVDDEGVNYSTYYYSTDSIAFTASIEDKSEKVMNIGCGCSYSMFNDKSEDYQHSVLTMSSLLACVAGGYSIDDINFMFDLFKTVANDGRTFYYKNGVYLVNYETKEDSSVLFMISPAKESIKDEWELQDYESFKKQ